MWSIVTLTDGSVRSVDNPSDMPDPGSIDMVEEPFVRATIMVPNEFVGAVMELCQDKRGTFINMEYITPERAKIEYDMPLAEILLDFFDKLKSRTKGCALA